VKKSMYGAGGGCAPEGRGEVECLSRQKKSRWHPRGGSPSGERKGERVFGSGTQRGTTPKHWFSQAEGRGERKNLLNNSQLREIGSNRFHKVIRSVGTRRVGRRGSSYKVKRRKKTRQGGLGGGGIERTGSFGVTIQSISKATERGL